MASTAFTPNPVPAPALTPIQEQIVARLAAGQSIRDISRECNVHRNTIANWRRTNPAFAQALAAAQYDRVLYWRDAGEEHAYLAIYTIARILQDPKAPAGVRLRAALAMLDHATTLPPAEQPQAPSAQRTVETTTAPEPEPAPEPAVNEPGPVPPTPKPATMHNPAQPNPAQPAGPCPCGIGPEHNLWCLHVAKRPPHSAQSNDSAPSC